MRNKLVIIAGGSGSGKSALAVNLRRAYPELFALLQADDYYRTAETVPRLSDGRPNWDTPDALLFDDMVRDVERLLNDTSITILTKSELHNPGYKAQLRNKTKCTIMPRPILLLEGYLTLYDERLRRLADLSVYLDMPIEVSMWRRSANKFDAPASYFESVLIPIHQQFVEPTRKYADAVIDVSRLAIEEVFAVAEKILTERVHA